MMLNPTESNVYLFLFQTGIYTMKKLVLALTIHDENITMVKLARASRAIRTELALPFEKTWVTKLSRNNELGPRSPNSGSESLCHSTCEFPPGKGSGS